MRWILKKERELFETYYKDVYKTCFYMLHRTADAEDVCQEVFVTAFRQEWQQVQHPKAWLMKIAVNQCMNHLKKERRWQAKRYLLQRNAVAGKEPSAELVAEGKEAAVACRRLLQRLPVKIRAVLSLRYLNECSLNEIAGILGIPEGTVKSRLNKGMKLLRNVLKEMEEGDDRLEYNKRTGSNGYPAVKP